MLRRKVRCGVWRRAAWGLLAVAAAGQAEVCTTQSQMKEADRQALVTAVMSLTKAVQANDTAALRAGTDAELLGRFQAVGALVAETAPKIAGGTAVVDQVYLLDATQMKVAAGASTAEAQFFCSLNKTASEADFTLPDLRPGVYAFAIVQVEHGTTPWRISYFLLREGGAWKMAGIYPQAAAAAGHDGLWYWQDARKRAADKQLWNAWLEYNEADALLRPTSFVDSTHLQKLRTEVGAAAPAAASDGVSADVPLVVKAADGQEFHVTAMTLTEFAGNDQPDVVAHVRVDPAKDAVAARTRNEDVMRALVGAYPELRSAFHGITVVADATGGGAFATEQPMAAIH